MDKLDLDTLLEAISADSPSGEDLEYDPDFLAMVQAAEGSPERRMGGSVVPAEDPDWRRVRALAIDLLRRSKDLRSGVLLTRALLQTEGLAGLGGGLALLNGLISGFWDDIHPRLDPEDGMDPSARVNVLLDLTGRDTMVMPLRMAPLIRSRVFGNVTYRDVEVAEGKTAATGDPHALDSAAIAGAFQDCDLDELSSSTSAAASALAAARSLNDAIAAHVPSDAAPNFAPLIDLLSAVHGLLQFRLNERQPATAAEGRSESGVQQAEGGLMQASSFDATARINSREDVVQALDRLCDYYTQCEPSSPVPLLLKRARRLVTGNFVDIVRDLAPDALPQIQKVCGIDDQS
jgi:type VI secretion system protein ImpA